MGVALSAQRGDSLAEVKHQWLLQYKESLIKYASASTLEKLEQGGTQLLALAYQASEAGHECSPSQSIRFQISKDGGETWSAARVVVWGLGPVWAPVLFYDAQRESLGGGRVAGGRVGGQPLLCTTRRAAPPAGLTSCSAGVLCAVASCRQRQGVRRRMRRKGCRAATACTRLGAPRLGAVLCAPQSCTRPLFCYCISHSPLPTDSKKLFLFYSESRKAYSPGGDIK